MPVEGFQTHAQSLAALAPVLVIFAIAGILVPFFQRFRLSPVLGYLLCGILIGPYGLALFADAIPSLAKIAVSDRSSVMLTGEIGIVFLMFMIGLEFSFRRLVEMKKLVLGLGPAQIVTAALAIAAVVSLFDNSAKVSVLVGISFALSSTAIVMQLLGEQHLTNRPVGVVAFSILLMQDLAVVPLLVVLGGMSGATKETPIALLLLSSLMVAATVISIIYLLGTRILRPVLAYLSPSKNPEWLLSLVVFLVIGAAMTTEKVGLSAALGAFLAGLLIAETDFRHEIEVIIDPLKSLLLGIFFLSVGMQIDIREFASHPFWVPVSVVGLFAVKAFCLYPVARLFKVPKQVALDVSVRLAQVGEFAFMVLGLAAAGGLLPQGDAQFFLLVASLSMLASPFLSRLSPWLLQHVPFFAVQAGSLAEPDPRLTDQPQVLIAGYGRIGQMLGNILEKQMVSYLAIENDFERVRHLRAKGHRVIYADTRKAEVWRRLRLDAAKAIVIAIDQPVAAEIVLMALRAEWPLMPIIVRTHDAEQTKRFYDLGATSAIPETLEVSLTVARETLSAIGRDLGDVDKEIERNRQTAAFKRTEAEKAAQSIDPQMLA